MIPIIWSALVILCSVALFAYWFRYSCILILRTRTTTDFGSTLSPQDDLTFDQIQRELETDTTTANLSSFRNALDRDYAFISTLMERAPGIGEHFSALEQSMLRADYRVMQAWDGLSRRLLRQPSRRAITEMSAIVGFFANAAGEAGLLSNQA